MKISDLPTSMLETLYRRPLPSDAIAFSSPEGRELFAEALASGGLGGYFPLAEQFHTQSEPTFCGLGSLVVALNALAIDPGRLWKGPWRWFSEELLDCCVPLEEIRQRGLDLDELACLARCNGADVDLHRADNDNLALWRTAVGGPEHSEGVVIASYDRDALGQTGTGHASPIGGYLASRDLVLVLDVARFKYPPHWISAERLWRAMQVIDPATNHARGWLVLRRRAHGVALGFTLSCGGQDLHELARRLSATLDQLGPMPDLSTLARSLAPLASNLVMREPSNAAHQTAIAGVRSAVRALAVFPQVVGVVGAELAEAVTILVLVLADRLAPAERNELVATITKAADDATLAAEIEHVRAQLRAVLLVCHAPTVG